jgi:NADPH:quinone reductase-like Zn-dependent oxidoreductase
MKALVVTKNGAMEIREQPLLPLGPRKIRVRTEFAGVGFADLMAVSGGYPLAPHLPFSPGYEFLGTIEEIGSQVSAFTLGQRVAGMLPKMGCYGEFLDIDPVWAVAVPPSLHGEQAAAMPLNYLTARALIEGKAHLKRGDSFLIHGAAGGVGSAALELAREKGLRAYGTVSAGKERDVEALGAIPLRRGEHWFEEALTHEPRGFSAVFDAFGGNLLRQSYKVVAPGGVLVSYGFASSSRGGTAAFADGLWFHVRMKFLLDGKSTAICGVPAQIDRGRFWYRGTLARLFNLAASGHLSPKVCEVVPWEQAELAHQHLRTGNVRGKILLDFSS